MYQSHKCPQCGTDLLEGNFSHPGCFMCGWGKDASPTLYTPSSKLSDKSFKWKAGSMAAAAVMLLVLAPIINLGTNQVLASNAVKKANKQMDKRLYASAARTLNQAPISPPLGETNKQMDQMLGNSIRWARDISDVKIAKKSIVEEKPEEALDNLDNIEEDFPQEDETVDLIDMAQDQTIDSEIDVSQEEVDEVAFTPDDPEAGNIDEIADEAQDEQAIDIAEEPVAAAQATAAGQPAAAPTAEPAEVDVAEAELEDIPDDVTEAELPDAPEEEDPATAALPAAKKPSKLVPLYAMGWFNKVPPGHTDQDSFLTTDLAGEYNTQRDKKSGFGPYYQQGALGQLYKRKVKGNRNVVPLYRYWSANRTDHFYTTNPKFSSSNPNAKYIRQQAAGYIGKWDGKQCLAGNKPLFKTYNKNVSDNHYHTNQAWIAGLAKGGWKDTEIIGCIW